MGVEEALVTSIMTLEGWYFESHRVGAERRAVLTASSVPGRPDSSGAAAALPGALCLTGRCAHADGASLLGCWHAFDPLAKAPPRCTPVLQCSASSGSHMLPSATSHLQASMKPKRIADIVTPPRNGSSWICAKVRVPD